MITGSGRKKPIIRATSSVIVLQQKITTNTQNKRSKNLDYLKERKMKEETGSKRRGREEGGGTMPSTELSSLSLLFAAKS